MHDSMLAISIFNDGKWENVCLKAPDAKLCNRHAIENFLNGLLAKTRSSGNFVQDMELCKNCENLANRFILIKQNAFSNYK